MMWLGFLGQFIDGFSFQRFQVGYLSF